MDTEQDKVTTLKGFFDRISQKIATLAERKNRLLQGYRKEIEKKEVEQIKKGILEN
jgi:hypothetical protein